MAFVLNIRAPFFAPPVSIERRRLKDDALSKQLTKEINLNGFFGPDRLFQAFLFVDDSGWPELKPKFARPEKVYLRTIEMKICVFRTNAENNKSTGKHFTSILFCFVFAFFRFQFGRRLGVHARKKKSKDKTFIVPRRICFWISWLLNCTSQWVGSVVARTPKQSQNFACCQLNYVKKEFALITRHIIVV